MNPPTTIAPFPTASGAIGCNETVYQGDATAHEAHVFGGAIAFSVGAPDNALDGLLVEEPIDYERAISVLQGARQVEEQDFPVGGPFGA